MCRQDPSRINCVGFRACTGAPSPNAVMGERTEEKKWRSSRAEVKLTLFLNLCPKSPVPRGETGSPAQPWDTVTQHVALR